MSKDGRFARMLRILTSIEARPGVKIRHLAETCEASERTIYRDLDILKQAGVPLYNDNGYRLAGDFFLPPLQLTLTEGMALALATKTISAQKGVPFAPMAQSALEKVTAALHPTVKAAIGSQNETILYDSRPVVDYANQQELFALIEKARGERRTIELVYHTFAREQSNKRLVDPYGLIYKMRRWYLVGFCHWRQEVKMFRIDRIKTAKIMDTGFDRPTSFSLDTYLGDAWQVLRGKAERVRIRFSGTAAQLVKEGRWHPTQKLTLRGDQLELDVSVSSPAEMISWILSFGGDAEIIEPPALRQLAIDHAAAVTAVYANLKD